MIKYNSAVFTSDLLRAYRTAEIITKEHQLAIIARKELRERSFGKHEGRLAKELRKKLQEFYNIYDRLPSSQRRHFRFDGEGESDAQLMSRFITVIREIALAYLGKNVLIVTHGGVMRCFLIHLGFGDGKSLPSGSIKNLALVQIDSDGVDFFIKRVSGVEKIV